MKYLSEEDWKQYLNYHMEAVRQFINNIPENPNKGVKFEILVAYLLEYMFEEDELSFQPTKSSHDGNKDFWAIDEANEVWWAECKNYTPNIALTQLAPTLVMAEINQVRHLMFFSYSKLNVNLKRRIAQYSYKYNKEVFLYDDEALEQLIFSYSKDTLQNINQSIQCRPIEELELDFFNEINAAVINRYSFDENYNIEELNVGSVYDLNVVLTNRHFNSQIKVTVSVDCAKNLYFDFLNNNIDKELKIWKEEIVLEPNQIKLIKCKVRAKKKCKCISLPQLVVTYEKNGVISKQKSTESKNYVCNWNKKMVLIGKQYEDIIKNFSDSCSKRNCALLVYGSSGTGKTRILEECNAILIKNNFNVINFIGFDRESSWKDIIQEISYQVFGIDRDLAAAISCDLDDIIAPQITDSLKRKIIEFLRLLKSEREVVVDYAKYYEIIFYELQKHRYAIIIDNMQSYSPALIDFIRAMVRFMSTKNIKQNNFALLFSLNTTLIYDKEYLDFIADFQQLSGIHNKTCYISESVNGFNKEEQAITYLKTLLCLDEYPLNYSYLKEVLKKTSLKPKYIEIIASRLIQEECIQIQDGIGCILDSEKFKNIINTIPPKYEEAFISNFNYLISIYSNWEADIKDILALVYFLHVLTDRTTGLLGLNKEALLVLCEHDVLKEIKTSLGKEYVFEHDLVEMTLYSRIYPNILEHAISCIIKHTQVYQATLKDQYEQYILCKLFTQKVSKEEIMEIWINRKQANISNKFIYKFYLYFIYNMILLRKNFSEAEFIFYMSNCCKEVRDHISEVQAEELFNLAYTHIKDMPRESTKAKALYFSFIIHHCENKIRLEKVSECLAIYYNYYKELEENIKEFPGLNCKLQYAKAYINNRIFVCGKLQGAPRKYLKNWFLSVMTAKRNHFWDIQFENYFDVANLYLNDKENTTKLLYNLEKGFSYYEKLSKQLKQKFSVNNYSKSILYFLIKKEYTKSLNIIEEALLNLKDNSYVNYHIFFREKYIKYKIINLMLSKDLSIRLDKCMEEYEHLLSLTGHIKNNYEWIFLQAKYAYFLNNDSNFSKFFEKYYKAISIQERIGKSKEYFMLEELAVKYRSKHSICEFVNERATDLSDINYILKMDYNSFIIFENEYKTAAPVADLNEKGGYYL